MNNSLSPALACLMDLRHARIEVETNGQHLRFWAPWLVDMKLRKRILAQKQALVELLVAGVSTPICPRCDRRWLNASFQCWSCCDRLCLAGCGRLTGSAFLECCLICESTDVSESPSA